MQIILFGGLLSSLVFFALKRCLCVGCENGNRLRICSRAEHLELCGKDASNANHVSPPFSAEKDDMEEGVTTHSGILAWRILWTEEPGGLQSMGSPRVRHD